MMESMISHFNTVKGRLGAFDGPMGRKHLAKYLPSSKANGNFGAPPSGMAATGSFKQSELSQSPRQVPLKQLKKTKNMISSKTLTQTIKQYEGHQAWTSSEKEDYLRLSKGKRAQTEQDIFEFNPFPEFSATQPLYSTVGYGA